MSQPNISVRRSIAWHHDPPSEPTSTLVLTSQKRHFIDIRILKPGQSASSFPPNDSSSDFDSLDWAFAGQSEVHGENDSVPTHGIWHHWIDSRVPLDQDPPPDEGDLFPCENGDTLEIGSMTNPATGILTQYKEVWRDIRVEMVGREKSRVCVVLRLDHPRGEARGCVVRVGQFVQGMVRVRDGMEEEVGIERWRWMEDGEEVVGGEEGRAEKGAFGEGEDGGGRWERVVKMGLRDLPCSVTFDAGKVQLGQRVDGGEIAGCTWVVTEVYKW